jgi:putative CocE/NonD family hydrolase
VLNLISHAVERVLKLEPPLTRDLVVERDLRAPMRDGVELLADRWAPRRGGGGLPVALLRCPYGRRGYLPTVLARPLAERGFQVVVQSIRGTFGSGGGTFDPLRHERDDGLATLEWIIKQPWFGDSIVLFGQSYLGYVQWANADRLPPQVKAMIPIVTESALTLEFLRGDGLSLEVLFNWAVLTSVQERLIPIAAIGALLGSTTRAIKTLPLREADVAAIGRPIAYVQDALVHDASSPRWAGVDHRERVAQTKAPVSSIAGWYDIFLPGQLRDFEALQKAGRPARLTVGPWAHLNQDRAPFDEAFDFGLKHARGEQPVPRKAVRLYVMGAQAWREFDTWPPAGYAPRRFYLQAARALKTDLPAQAQPDRYRYDPTNPTPAVGGVRFGNGAGRANNTKLEARSDVLAYSTEPLEQDVEVIGNVTGEIWFRSSLPFADVFVRLCDVDERGRSFNVCDNLVSLRNATEPQCVTVSLWPTAYVFKRGHRIRVQVSSGAFPRFARNPGTGESHATATQLRAADQEIFHDPARPSAIVLPVRA